MPENVTIFTKDRKLIDKLKNCLKPPVFMPHKVKNELSVFDIDSELQQKCCDDLIFKISDEHVFKGPSFAKARGDMKSEEIQSCDINGVHFYIEVNDIPKGHCNIKPIDDLNFDTERARKLSQIARLKIRE